ncbi:MAG: RsmB/NOP family class I SAM-dependent RNA methyltransferase [Acidobacteriota bacterium]
MPSSLGSGLRAASASPDPRQGAARILVRVETGGAHAARLLGAAPGAMRELVLGVLRWQLTLDYLIARHLRLPLGELEPEVRAILRTGLYEAQRMRTPAPVAVAEAVRVAKLMARRATGLINAVLRRAVAEPWPDPEDESLPLAQRFSHPAWLIERWQGILGEALTRRILAASQQPAPLWVLPGAGGGHEMRLPGVEIEPHPYVGGCFSCRAGASALLEEVTGGRAYAIDPHAVVVARLLPCPGGLCVDLAAAPGGKSIVLAGERRAGTPVACDRHLGRVALMRRNFRLLPAPPLIFAADATRPPLRAGGCAAVLLDAPCSGSGTLRRHPEIRWRLTPAHLVELAGLQRRLLRAAIELLAPGGWLLYATCSLEPEENVLVLAEAGLEVVPLEARIETQVPHLALPGGGVILVPLEWGDGFTVHLLRRP